MRILVAEDDTQLLSALVGVLRNAGHEVIKATNGREAVVALHENETDLVVSDVLMPEMDAFEVLDSLRKRPDRPKFLAISGGGWLSSSYYLETAKVLGADRILAKPFGLSDFLSLVSDFEPARASA